MFGHDNQDNNVDEVIHDTPAPVDNPVSDNFVSDSSVIDTPADDVQTPTDDGAAYTQTPVPNHIVTPAATDDLLDIKQEALQALTPLVGQLDQTPEEQFRTTMMMIQASDDHSLVKAAYAAAKQISNEKERAQALLDIVNEINYFTQHTQA